MTMEWLSLATGIGYGMAIGIVIIAVGRVVAGAISDLRDWGKD